MYQVYKITNKINGKSYIGSSKDALVRWHGHKKSAGCPGHQCYNYPLQRAFRKYGIINFSFEILRDDFSTRYEAEEYEQQMIIKYQTLFSDNGYNQRLETHGGLTDENRLKNTVEQSQPCALVDFNENIITKYPSYAAAARAHGLNSQVGKVCKGIYSSARGLLFRDLDERGNVVHVPLKPYQNQQAVIAINVFDKEDTITFKSLSEAAKYFNTNRQEIYKCTSGQERYSVVKFHLFRNLDPYGNIILNQVDIDNKILEYDKKYPNIRGERKSVSEWCALYNIKTATYYYRIRHGQSPSQALGIKNED